jgi:hypothetical protein
MTAKRIRMYSERKNVQQEPEKAVRKGRLTRRGRMCSYRVKCPSTKVRIPGKRRRPSKKRKMFPKRAKFPHELVKSLQERCSARSSLYL